MANPRWPSVNVESEADSDDFQEEPLPCSSQQTEVDLSQLYLTSFPLTDFFGPTARYVAAQIVELNLSNNQFMQLPSAISQFINLQSLDLSNNQFVNLSEELSSLTKLRSLAARNNLLEDLPKSLQFLQRLESVNLSGNSFESIPPALFEMTSLKSVHFGANMIDHLPSQIGQLRRLEVLYLSGNRLVEVPAAIGRLRNLTSLALADNRLETIPPTFAELQSLQSLSLHNNQLKTLPTGIARLRNLEQLSLRNNPLVTKFVNDISFDPPSLKELAARIVKINVPSEEVRSTMLPREVNTYLRSANQCVNPRCKGVYFEARAEHIKFVDFCGKYRVPLLHYLCSPKCSTATPAYAISDYSSESEEELQPLSEYAPQDRMKKVLLG